MNIEPSWQTSSIEIFFIWHWHVIGFCRFQNIFNVEEIFKRTKTDDMSMSNKDYFNGASLTWWFVQQLDVYTDYPELCFILIALFSFVDQTSALFLAAKLYHLIIAVWGLDAHFWWPGPSGCLVWKLFLDLYRWDFHRNCTSCVYFATVGDPADLHQQHHSLLTNRPPLRCIQHNHQHISIDGKSDFASRNRFLRISPFPRVFRTNFLNFQKFPNNFNFFNFWFYVLNWSPHSGRSVPSSSGRHL